MTIEKQKAAVEAILFASGEPVELQRISEALQIDKSKTHDLLNSLISDIDNRNSGIALLNLDGKFQLVTRGEFTPIIREALALKRNTPLSQAAFEVLAIVAYNQPVTKSFIEQIRGVDCSGVIYTLCQRQLIEEAGRLDLPGRPLLYCTTTNFLRCFCLSSLEDLPVLPEAEESDLNALLSEKSDKNDEDQLTFE